MIGVVVKYAFSHGHATQDGHQGTNFDVSYEYTVVSIVSIVHVGRNIVS